MKMYVYVLYDNGMQRSIGPTTRYSSLHTYTNKGRFWETIQLFHIEFYCVNWFLIINFSKNIYSYSHRSFHFTILSVELLSASAPPRQVFYGVILKFLVTTASPVSEIPATAADSQAHIIAFFRIPGRTVSTFTGRVFVHKNASLTSI